MDDTVAESEGAIGNIQRPEEAGFFAADVVDSHSSGKGTMGLCLCKLET
jgi:hypothetical protein